MLLGAISLLDCGVFVLCLIPNLLVQAGPVQTIALGKILPFLIFKLPYQFVHERYFVPKDQRSPFVQTASFFQDLVIRIVRYAFANVPARIGRVFFSKWVALPFFRFRLLRNGFLRSPISCREINENGVRGIWAVYDEASDPDIVIYYCHGGGFSMGSSYFYLEFLLAWMGRLKEAGFANPAIFSLDYTLVPDATWPVQYEETFAGYKFVCDRVSDSSKICLSGDSAGATLMTSLLISMAEGHEVSKYGKPGLAVLISPWAYLVSHYNRNTPSDYLDRTAMHIYAKQYVGNASLQNPRISPGLSSSWQKASPKHGYFVIYGAEELLAKGIMRTVKNMKSEGAMVETYSEEAGIHAWPVVKLFLGETQEERCKGLDIMTGCVVARMLPK